MKIIKGLLPVILIILTSCSKTGQPARSEKIINVETQIFKPASFSRPIRSSGRVSSTASMKLSFKIGGIIDHIYASEGQFVKAGEIIAILKQDEIAAKVELARIRLTKAERDFKRIQNLYADSVATLEQLQNGRSGLTAAESQYKIAVFNQNHAIIKAPENGQILKKLCEENEMINTGYPAFIFGSMTGNWLIHLGVNDRDVIRLSCGDSAAIQLDAFPARNLSGSVTRIAAAPDQANGLYEIEITLKSPSLKLINGFIARANLFPAPTGKGYKLPLEALVEVNDKMGSIFIIGPDGRAKRRQVQILCLLNNEVVVDPGQETFLEIVVLGASFLKDGSLVKGNI